VNTLRNEYTIRSTDLRDTLNITASTLYDYFRKLQIEYADPLGKGASKQIPGSQVRKLLEFKGYRYPDRSKVISFMNQKGGCSKTTNTFFLSQRLSSYGARVLSIDSDSQANLTSAFNLEQYGLEMDESTSVLVDVIEGKASIEETVIAITPTLHLIPSSPYNATLEGKIRDNFKNPTLAFRQIVDKMRDRYDFILIDCSPALNLTNTAIISTSELVIIPVEPSKFSKIGLNLTLKEIEQIEKDFNLKIDSRIVFTKFDQRQFISMKYLGETAAEHPDKMLKTMIRTSTDVATAVAKKEDLFGYKKSNGKDDYDSLARELMGLHGVLPPKVEANG
jgi:chromosome partitioning protein